MKFKAKLTGSPEGGGFAANAIAEAKVFLTAIQFLTRLPTPSLRDFSPEWLDRSAKYFPLVGLIVGAISAVMFVVAQHIWRAPLPALVALASGIFVTGALHEDGFADFFDCIGGATREARLAIMKDSRLGVFGALALVFGVTAKIFALTALPMDIAPAALIATHAAARLAPLLVISRMTYAGEPSAAKVPPLSKGVEPLALLIPASFALAPFVLLANPFTVLGLGVGIVAAALVAWRAWVLLGGYTGDVLGAVEQSFEIGCLLGMAAWT